MASSSFLFASSPSWSGPLREPYHNFELPVCWVWGLNPSSVFQHPHVHAFPLRLFLPKRQFGIQQITICQYWTLRECTGKTTIMTLRSLRVCSMGIDQDPHEPNQLPGNRSKHGMLFFIKAWAIDSLHWGRNSDSTSVCKSYLFFRYMSLQLQQGEIFFLLICPK